MAPPDSPGKPAVAAEVEVAEIPLFPSRALPSRSVISVKMTVFEADMTKILLVELPLIARLAAPGPLSTRFLLITNSVPT
jgi:hypothetical protein